MRLTKAQMEREFGEWKGKNYRHYGPMEMGTGTYELQAFEEGMRRGYRLALKQMDAPVKKLACPKCGGPTRAPGGACEKCMFEAATESR